MKTLRVVSTFVLFLIITSLFANIEVSIKTTVIPMFDWSFSIYEVIGIVVVTTIMIPLKNEMIQEYI